jgi:hypothetical protein
MSERVAKFQCAGCGMTVWAADAHYRERQRRPMCFLCLWVRANEPDSAKWAALRAEFDRE